MAKRKGISYEQKMLNALESLPNPIADDRHGLVLYFIDNRARSNETRFEHIIKESHRLLLRDILSIPEGIRKSRLKKDKHRKWTYNYIFERKGVNKEYIWICVQSDKDDPHIVIVKTIFISKKDK